MNFVTRELFKRLKRDQKIEALLQAAKEEAVRRYYCL
jgi:hypothetical protein